MSSLTADQVALQLDNLDGWRQEGAALIKTYHFVDFASAMVFMQHGAFYAHSLQHYPVWHNHYNEVVVRIGNLEHQDIHSRDIQLAKRLDAIAQGRPDPL